MNTLQLTDASDRRTAALTLLSIRAAARSLNRHPPVSFVYRTLASMTDRQANEAESVGALDDARSLNRICAAARKIVVKRFTS